MSAARQIPIELDHEAIAQFCQTHHIAKLSLFGSVLRDDFTDESDVDMLVEFEKGHVPGYFGLVGMEIELTDQLGRKVDLRRHQELSPYIAEDVLKTALQIYVS